MSNIFRLFKRVSQEHSIDFCFNLNLPKVYIGRKDKIKNYNLTNKHYPLFVSISRIEGALVFTFKRITNQLEIFSREEFEKYTNLNNPLIGFLTFQNV